MQKGFIIKFEDDKLISAEGDFELSENFNTPFNAPAPQNKNATPAKNKGS